MLKKQKEKCLNLGCGKNYMKSNEKQEWINLDFIKFPKVDVVHDLESFPYPFRNNTFDKIFCSHILEHLSDLRRVMKEIYRISKDQAIIKIRVPHFSSFTYYTDPAHKIPFAYLTFDNLLGDFICETEYKDKKAPLFKILKRKLNFTRTRATFLNKFINPILNINPIMYERFFCWIFPCSEVIYDLKIIKNKKQRNKVITEGATI